MSWSPVRGEYCICGYELRVHLAMRGDSYILELCIFFFFFHFFPLKETFFFLIVLIVSLNTKNILRRKENIIVLSGVAKRENHG